MSVDVLTRPPFAEAIEAARGGNGEPAWAARLRAQAAQSYAAHGLPGAGDEEWLSTSVAAIANGAFRAPRPFAGGLSPEGFTFGEGTRLAFVDGIYSPQLSTLGQLPAGVLVLSLAAAMREYPELLEGALGKTAAFQHHPFVALNTAAWRDGAFLRIPGGTCLTTPIHLLHLASGDPAISQPRHLLLLGESSHATVFETYASLGEGIAFTNAVTEVVAGRNASIDHYKLQCENISTQHVGTLHLRQERDSNAVSHVFSLGGAVTRNEASTLLEAPGAACTFNGLALADGRQHVDCHTRIDHAAPNCESREHYRTILLGRSTGVFNGRIHVHKDAQKSDAKQSNHSLLLSEEAVMQTRPQLEIFADDVKCTHGATIGRLDADSLFYLRSRGIGAAAARTMLVYAFAAEITRQVRVAPARERVEKMFLSRLPGGGE